MAKIVSGVGNGKPTKHGKRMIALATYQKGCSFIAAAILLKQYGGDRSVVLHLLSQGLEVFLKGILLVVDYDMYKPQLRKLGHNLVKTSEVAMTAAGLATFKGKAREELEALNALYSKHWLRYGTSYDVLVDARTIPYSALLRRAAALVRRIQHRGVPNAKAIKQQVPVGRPRLRRVRP